MKFDRGEFEDAIGDYENNWRAVDDVLYEVCRRYPRHDENAGVGAKVLLIGRTYATGIERKIKSTGAQGSSMTQLAGFLRKHHARVDAILSKLHGIAEPLDPDKLPAILDAHGRFVNLLKLLVRQGQTPRSFAAKYLHFHCPALPIMDTVVTAAVRKLIPWADDLIIFPRKKTYDEEYCWYIMRFWRLFEIAARAGVYPSVRHLDYYLLSQGGGGP